MTEKKQNNLTRWMESWQKYFKTDSGILSLALFQIALWTVVVGFMIIYLGFMSLKLPAIPGPLLLLMGMVLWGFARLWTAAANIRSLPAIAVLVGAALHATIDYVWHFPAVPLILAALVGSGAAITPGKTGPGHLKTIS